MAFFDFLKGKNKNQEAETPEDIKLEETKQEGISIEGLIITPLPTKAEDDEDIAIKIAADKRGRAAMNRAVHNAMDVNTVQFVIGAGGTMYQKGSLDDDELEEIDGIEGVEISGGIEEISEIGEAAEEFEEIIATEEGAEIKELEELVEALEEITVIEEVAEIETEAEIEEVAETEAVEEISIIEEIEETEETEEIEEIEETEEIDELEQAPKKGFFAKLVEGLGKTRKSILDNVDTVLGAFTKIDEDLFEELEEVLIMADLGVETTMRIIESLKVRVKKERATDPKLVKGLLIEEITAILENTEVSPEALPSPTVMLVIGVNGVGKTTTIGKLAQSFKLQGKTVLLAAADTFRAAAIEQLEVWGERAGIEVIKQQENSDPAAVIFDAVSAAKRRKTDLLICDTAGRLHNKKNLMDELKKIAKVIDREYPNAHKEIYLVLDATTGQNAMQQAKLFKETADITGIILTKLDGTAKGGIVIAISSELKIPVRYIGVGEGIADLQKFDSKAFAKALFGENE